MFKKVVWTYGLVLTRRFWEGYPYLVALLTPRLGVVEVRLWGNKRRANLVGLEPMALSWLEIEFSFDGAQSTYWEPVEPFGVLRKEAPEELLNMGVLVERLLPQHEPVPGVFKLALRCLRNRSACSDYPLLAAFVAGMLDLLGYGVAELVGGKANVQRLLLERPEELFGVCQQVLKEVLGVEV